MSRPARRAWPQPYRWRCTDHLPCVAFGYCATEQAAHDELWSHNVQCHMTPATKEEPS